jgi:hypothetical protein
MDTCLKPGSYTIVQAGTPSGYVDGQLTAGNVTAIPNSVGTHAIDVTLGSTDSTNNNFGEIKAASLSGFVYLDPDNDGVMQPGENGIGGVAISLSGTDDLGNDVALTQTTAADGSYHFASLRPGNYTLKETPPSGYLDGKDSIGSQGGTVGIDQLSDINLASAVNGINNNFAVLPQPAAVTSQGIPDQTQIFPGVVTKRDSLMLFWHRRGIETTVDSL